MKPSAFTALPEDLATLSPPNDPAFLFSKLVRPWTWREGAPDIGARGRDFAEKQLDLWLPEIVEIAPSKDGATKMLLRMRDGARVEAVHMPRAVTNPRVTMCISSQVGCAMGCTFCATGTMGLARNLDASEMVGQVLSAMRTFGPQDPSRVNIVFMGMGEPLHNVTEVLRATRVFCDPRGLSMSPARITVSTAGLVPGIEALARAEIRPTLAVSLNATTDEARARTMPIARTWTLARVREALSKIELRPHEKITLAYVLIDGENDANEDAERLADFARGVGRHIVNVIPFNDWPGAIHRAPSEDRVRAFVDRVRSSGAIVRVRSTRARDVRGACGTLVTAQALRPA